MSDAPEASTTPTTDPAGPPPEGQPDTPQPEADQSPATGRRPNSVTILVAIAVALLAAILALNLVPRGAGASDDAIEIARKKAERDVLRSTINAERSRLGMPPLDDIGGAEDPQTVANRISRDADALSSMLSRYDQLIIERDSMIAEKGAALVQSEQQRQALTSSIARLQDQLEKALIDSSSSDLARRRLELEQKRAEDLAAQLQQAQAALAASDGAVSKADYDRLLTQLEEARNSRDFFEDRANKLEEQLAAYQAETVEQDPDLFADDESELLPAAVKLFQALRKLEGRPDSEVMAAYSRFGNELGATVLRKLSFPTGVSDLTNEDLLTVNELAPNLPNRGLVFAVGYASVTGNVDQNRELSSSRATNAAEAINAHKLSAQQVQAAYLGQTKRFSSTIPERNQIVEIWHILPPAPTE